MHTGSHIPVNIRHRKRMWQTLGCFIARTDSDAVSECCGRLIVPTEDTVSIRTAKNDPKYTLFSAR